MFETPNEFLSAIKNAPEPDTNAIDKATLRQNNLTKPPGALGRLEDIAIWLAGWHATEHPTVDNIQIIVFAGNHGITRHGVSPYPSEVTQQMVENFRVGGAAINAFAKNFDYKLDVIPLDLDKPVDDWTEKPAMTEQECLKHINAGARAIATKTDLLVLGEMGIGNTTSAAALAAATFGGSGSDWAGPGTGLDEKGINNKAAIIDAGLTQHKNNLQNAFEKLARLGGRELSAIAGAIVAARLQRLPVLLDGYVVTAAAATLFNDNPKALTHCLAGHLSAEPAHRKLLSKLGLNPILDLEMRLGEGTGATLAASIVQAAAASHNHMATFEQAGVTDRT